jgi:hypothetical protein
LVVGDQAVLVRCSTVGPGVAKGALKLIAARLPTVSSSAVALSRLPDDKRQTGPTGPAISS